MSDDPGNMEMLFHGAKGAKGERGEKGDAGARGLTSKTARSIVALFLLAFLLAAANFVFTAHYVRSQQAAARAQQAAQQAVQRRAGELVERALCTDLGTMARIPPPAGNPAQNPSRSYEQAEARAWRGLVRVLDCR